MPATSVLVDGATMIESNAFPQASQGWANRPIPQQVVIAGPTHIEFDAKPSNVAGGPIDAVIGFADGAVDSFSDLGPILRFNPQGRIDARNGDAYMAESAFSYALLTEYHVRLVIDLVSKRYSAFVRLRFGGWPEVEIARDYAFRTEQSTLSRIDTMAGIIDSASGALSWGNVDVTPEICQSPAPGWMALPFTTQTGRFRVMFDAIPWTTTGTTIDAVAGIARFHPKQFTDLAANIRFNPSGNIDARSGDGYVAIESIPYQLGHTYRFLLEVDHTAKRYAASVTDLAAPFDTRTISRNLAFRSSQNTVVTLGWQGAYVDGPGCCFKTCNLMVWNY